jgi:hypothetical protein
VPLRGLEARNGGLLESVLATAATAVATAAILTYTLATVNGGNEYCHDGGMGIVPSRRAVPAREGP